MSVFAENLISKIAPWVVWLFYRRKNDVKHTGAHFRGKADWISEIQIWWFNSISAPNVRGHIILSNKLIQPNFIREKVLSI
jgi:hypothetical protein